jgi:hypothetical protein
MRVNEIEKIFIEIFGGIKYIDKYNTIYFNRANSVTHSIEFLYGANKIIPSNTYQIKKSIHKKNQSKNNIVNEKFGIIQQ